jgi:hypothetical protein
VGDLSTERGQRTVTVVRKGGRRATVPLAPRTSEAIDALLSARQSPVGDPSPLFATRTGGAWTATPRKVIARLARVRAHREGDQPAQPPALVRHRSRSTREPPSATSRMPPGTPTPGPPAGTTGDATASTGIPPAPWPHGSRDPFDDSAKRHEAPQRGRDVLTLAGAIQVAAGAPLDPLGEVAQLLGVLQCLAGLRVVGLGEMAVDGERER